MSRQQSFDKVDILGVSIDVLYLSQAINYICTYAADRSRPAGYVVKPYVEFLDRAARDKQLTGLLNGAELSIADGVAVIWAAHYLYAGPRTVGRFFLTLAQILLAPAELAWPLPERAAGTNFTWPLLKAAAGAKLRVFLIGQESTPAIERVAAVIRDKVPGINIVGTLSGRDPATRHGKVSQDWISQAANLLESTEADLVLVGMGFPLQERVCADLASQLKHGLLVGEGGTFDYESFGGTKRKAPTLMQRLGLEWLWRLLLEPKRLIRQLAIPRFIGKIWQLHR